MFDPIVSAIERFITDFSWRRLVIWVLFIGFLGVLMVAYESYTDHFRLAKLEKATSLLAKLTELEQDSSINKDERLRSVYDEIAVELNSVVRRAKTRPFIGGTLLKGVVGASPWILFLLLTLVPGIRKGEKYTGSLFLGLFILIVMFGSIGMLLPNSLGPLILYVVYPLGHFALVVIFILRWQARKKKAA